MAEEPAARRLLLIRHGHYERTGDLGDEVWGLSPLGRRQAARTARRLSRLIPTYAGDFEGIYSSPWPRAFQTAEIAAHELAIETVRVKPYLHECLPLVPAPVEGSAPIHPTLPISTEEDRAVTVDQVQRVLSRFFKPTKRNVTFALFCHGNLIRYLIADTLGLPYETWMRMDCCHGSISEVRIYPAISEP